MGEHLNLNDFLLLRRRLLRRLHGHWLLRGLGLLGLGHHLLSVSHHVLLHFHGNSLLDLELIESLALSFLDDFILELLLQPEHFNHSWFIPFHHFNNVISARMTGNLRYYVEKSFVPVNKISFARF